MTPERFRELWEWSNRGADEHNERIAKLLNVAEAAQFSIMKRMPWPDDEFVMVPKYEFFKLKSMLAALEADNDK